MDFDRLFLDYSEIVYRFMLNLTRNADLAEEFTQECFYKAYKSIDKFNGKCEISVWLCQIAKNSYFDYFRKAKAVTPHEGAVVKNTLEDKLVQEETLQFVHRVLHLMDEPYKEVFTLKVFGELSYRDISALFGKSENWARVVFFRAKAKIMDGLRDV